MHPGVEVIKLASLMELQDFAQKHENDQDL
jgi:hypothetical protein